jgi:hypothetical protein
MRENLNIQASLAPRDMPNSEIMVEYSSCTLIARGRNLALLFDLLWVYDFSFLQCFRPHIYAAPGREEPVIESLVWKDNRTDISLYNEAEYMVFRHPADPTWPREILK